MTSFCALLRGIGPGNPNMRNDKLRGVFERLGFADVASVISSGNIVFSTPDDFSTLDDRDGDVAALEDQIQAALQADLGIAGGTILRSRAELQALVDRAPFGNLTHGRGTYLTATFLRHALAPVPDPFPEPDEEAVRLVGYDADARAILTVTDNTSAKTPDFMSWLEKGFGKEMTTRTWLTVTRILKKLPAEV